VIDPRIRSIPIAIERQNLAVRAEPAVRGGGLVRQRIEEVEDAPRRRIDAPVRYAIAWKLRVCHRIAYGKRCGREVSVSHRGGRDDRLSASTQLPPPAAFIVGEEERAVRSDRPAEAAAVSVVVGVRFGSLRETPVSVWAYVRAFNSFELKS
jgi:hypothetical protein